MQASRSNSVSQKPVGLAPDDARLWRRIVVANVGSGGRHLRPALRYHAKRERSFRLGLMRQRVLDLCVSCVGDRLIHAF